MWVVMGAVAGRTIREHQDIIQGSDYVQLEHTGHRAGVCFFAHPKARPTRKPNVLTDLRMAR